VVVFYGVEASDTAATRMVRWPDCFVTLLRVLRETKTHVKAFFLL